MQPSNPNATPNWFGIKVSKPGIPVNQASDKQLVYKDDYSTKTYYDESNSRIIEGLLPNGAYGMWVSKPGFDAADPNAATNNNLIFNSSQDIFKIVSTGTSTLPSVSITTGKLTGIIIPHNLGYAPIANVYVNIETFLVINGSLINTASYVQLPVSDVAAGNFYVVSTPGTYLTHFYLYSAVDSTNLYVGGYFEASGGTETSLDIPLKYYLLQETAS